uniref:NADH dehydrogenase subunit 3 n=1 Tax=China mantispoides TaxID=3034372 RepID=UPI00241154CD|nr:NADH dehydrogenase subunit 3 [China mantispoides]WEL32775.1 NADH dehydrogenase subunit 3 [China mantispoides]
MNLMMMSMMITFIVPMIIMIMSSVISKKTMNDREKSSPFECGFDPKTSARMPFSLRFFMIAVIFLIFDVEIALIMPIIITMKWSSMWWWTMSMYVFIMILLIGTYFEWKQGALQWTD